ncbi:uncharacterized protein LOC26526881 [Drosophila erecta]|nr:uncharacterized protein LOC26526881 [Drosophila erecta]
MYSASRRSQSAHQTRSRAMENVDGGNGMTASFLDKYYRPNFRAIRTVIPMELPPFEQAPLLIGMLKLQITRRKQFIETSHALKEDLLKGLGGKRDAIFSMHGTAMGELKQAVYELSSLLHQLELVYEPVGYGKISVQAQQADKRAQISENLLHGRNEQLERHANLARSNFVIAQTNDARRRRAEKEEASKSLGIWRFH